MAAISLVSCAKAPLPPPEFSYGKDQIIIDINADSSLNMNEGRSHTLFLCIHQLRNPNGFNRLIGDRAGIYQLLECSQFDSSVTHSKRVIVQPDQKVSYSIDRAEGTKYVAIAGGYYNIRKDDVVALFEIPIVEKSLGMFTRTRVAEPGMLNIQLELGPQAIRGSVVK